MSDPQLMANEISDVAKIYKMYLNSWQISLMLKCKKKNLYLVVVGFLIHFCVIQVI